MSSYVVFINCDLDFDNTSPVYIVVSDDYSDDIPDIVETNDGKLIKSVDIMHTFVIFKTFEERGHHLHEITSENFGFARSVHITEDEMNASEITRCIAYADAYAVSHTQACITSEPDEAMIFAQLSGNGLFPEHMSKARECLNRYNGILQ